MAKRRENRVYLGARNLGSTIDENVCYIYTYINLIHRVCSVIWYGASGARRVKEVWYIPLPVQ